MGLFQPQSRKAETLLLARLSDIVEIIAIRLNCSPSDVRFGSIADIGELVCDVRLVPQEYWNYCTPSGR